MYPIPQPNLSRFKSVRSAARNESHNQTRAPASPENLLVFVTRDASRIRDIRTGTLPALASGIRDVRGTSWYAAVVRSYFMPARSPVAARAPYTTKRPDRCKYCGSRDISRKGTRLKKLEIVQTSKVACVHRKLDSVTSLIANDPVAINL
jgi:hypothetical protein